MKRYLILLVVAVCLVACGNKRDEQKKQLHQEVRTQFYDKELVKVEAELAKTDSLLTLAEADDDTLNVEKRIRLDSLKHEADVLGAKIRYIHKKQQEME